MTAAGKEALALAIVKAIFAHYRSEDGKLIAIDSGEAAWALGAAAGYCMSSLPRRSFGTGLEVMRNAAQFARDETAKGGTPIPVVTLDRSGSA